MMLPIYLRLGMSPVVLTCVAGLMNGTLNIVPWGSPTVRAASALSLQPTDIFVPMLPSLATGLVISLAFAGSSASASVAASPARSTPRASESTRGDGIFGASPLPRRRAEARCRRDAAPATSSPSGVRAMRSQPPRLWMPPTRPWPTPCSTNRPTLRPRLIWFNLALTVAVMVPLVLDLFPLAFVFMVGAAIALIVSFPKLKSRADEIVAHALDRRRRVDGPRRRCAGRRAQRHRDGDGDGLVDHGSDPRRNGTLPRGHTGVLSIPFTFFMSNDAFYGILPVLAESASHTGIAPVRWRAPPSPGSPCICEPARPGDPASGVAGERQPRRSPQEGAVAGRARLAGDARRRRARRGDPARRLRGITARPTASAPSAVPSSPEWGRTRTMFVVSSMSATPG
jgi:CitMHS family citrate-Mg2+:H+ or citrate-Ca2+:H+ symporter